MIVFKTGFYSTFYVKWYSSLILYLFPADSDGFYQYMFLYIIFSYTQFTGEEPIRKEIMDLYMTKDTDKDEAYAAGENILRLAITDEERAKAYAKWERLCMIK